MKINYELFAECIVYTNTFLSLNLVLFLICGLVQYNKGETIHHMYRNRDYFGDGSVHDTWRPLKIQTI